jgi:hypothetical protein
MHQLSGGVQGCSNKTLKKGIAVFCLVWSYRVLPLVLVDLAPVVLLLRLLLEVLGNVVHVEIGVSARHELLQRVIDELVLLLHIWVRVGQGEGVRQVCKN